MAEENAWTFAVTGEERLTLQGRENAASFEATVRRSQEPYALHSEGVVTGDDGAAAAEEIYVLGGTAYLKEGEAGWKQAAASEPGMRNKVEDPVAALERFTASAEGGGDAVTLKKADGTIRLSIDVDSQPLPEVRDRGAVKKALREFEPTAQQLRDAGVTVSEDGMTVAGLRQTLVLDAETYRIESHRFRFELLVPYGSGDISFVQDVREENQGTFDGGIRLPDGVA